MGSSDIDVSSLAMDDFVFHWDHQYASLTYTGWGKFLYTIIEKNASERKINVIMWSVYAFTLIVFALNIALSYVKSGWFTI